MGPNRRVEKMLAHPCVGAPAEEKASAVRRFQGREVVGIKADRNEPVRLVTVILDPQPDGLDAALRQGHTEETLSLVVARNRHGDADILLNLRLAARPKWNGIERVRAIAHTARGERDHQNQAGPPPRWHTQPA